jgi:spore germination cell wall hydrolase CwlJ-like protein
MKMKNLISTILTGALVTGTMFMAVPSSALSGSTSIEETNQPNYSFSDADYQCLALNIYYEARGSNLADKAAVADVVINRSLDRRYPASICGVVHDGYKAGRRDCQFSWYCDGKDDKPKNMDSWIEAQSIAFNMLAYNQYRGITEGATHYHATYVNPRWASSLQMVGRIGEHIFYRWE